MSRVSVFLIHVQVDPTSKKTHRHTTAHPLQQTKNKKWRFFTDSRKKKNVLKLIEEMTSIKDYEEDFWFAQVWIFLSKEPLTYATVRMLECRV